MVESELRQLDSMELMQIAERLQTSCTHLSLSLAELQNEKYHLQERNNDLNSQISHLTASISQEYKDEGIVGNLLREIGISDVLSFVRNSKNKTNVDHYRLDKRRSKSFHYEKTCSSNPFSPENVIKSCADIEYHEKVEDIDIDHFKNQITEWVDDPKIKSIAEITFPVMETNEGFNAGHDEIAFQVQKALGIKAQPNVKQRITGCEDVNSPGFEKSNFNCASQDFKDKELDTKTEFDSLQNCEDALAKSVYPRQLDALTKETISDSQEIISDIPEVQITLTDKADQDSNKFLQKNNELEESTRTNSILEQHTVDRVCANWIIQVNLNEKGKVEIAVQPKNNNSNDNFLFNEELKAILNPQLELHDTDPDLKGMTRVFKLDKEPIVVEGMQENHEYCVQLLLRVPGTDRAVSSLESTFSVGPLKIYKKNEDSQFLISGNCSLSVTESSNSDFKNNERPACCDSSPVELVFSTVSESDSTPQISYEVVKPFHELHISETTNYEFSEKIEGYSKISNYKPKPDDDQIILASEFRLSDSVSSHESAVARSDFNMSVTKMLDSSDYIDKFYKDAKKTSIILEDSKNHIPFNISDTSHAIEAPEEKCQAISSLTSSKDSKTSLQSSHNIKAASYKSQGTPLKSVDGLSYGMILAHCNSSQARSTKLANKNEEHLNTYSEFLKMSNSQQQHSQFVCSNNLMYPPAIKCNNVHFPFSEASSNFNSLNYYAPTQNAYQLCNTRERIELEENLKNNLYNFKTKSTPLVYMKNQNNFMHSNIRQKCFVPHGTLPTANQMSSTPLIKPQKHRHKTQHFSSFQHDTAASSIHSIHGNPFVNSCNVQLSEKFCALPVFPIRSMPQSIALSPGCDAVADSTTNHITPKINACNSISGDKQFSSNSAYSHNNSESAELISSKNVEKILKLNVRLDSLTTGTIQFKETDNFDAVAEKFLQIQCIKQIFCPGLINVMNEMLKNKKYNQSIDIADIMI